MSNYFCSARLFGWRLSLNCLVYRSCHIEYFPKCQTALLANIIGFFSRDFRNQSDAHVMQGLFWGSRGKTEEQTAAFQTVSSSRSHLNSESPHCHVPTASGSWTASLCVPQSSAPMGTQNIMHSVATRTHTDGLLENRNFTNWSWHLLEMWHLQDLFTAFVGLTCRGIKWQSQQLTMDSYTSN